VIQASDLGDQHRGDIPEELPVKADSTKDLLTMFSDLITVNFRKGKKLTNAKGRWCLLCRFVLVCQKCDKDLTIPGQTNSL